MFTKSANILAAEIWNALHSETGSGIISTRKWTHVPKTGFAVDLAEIQWPNRLNAARILDWVIEHRVGIDYVPNAYIGAHRSPDFGDSIFVVHAFGSYPQAVEFAGQNKAPYIYKLEEAV